ncbi:MAG TPA: hypothetical protein VHB68_04355, partial [Steroidobacteraceae bacterium]|nr:hypothetical protein [Steroidobacteraceae bacterium]
MVSKRSLGKGVAAGVAATALAAGALLVHAEQPAKARYFSFAGKVPTIHENNIRDIQVLVTGNQSAGRQSVLESYWGPAFTVPPHFHKKHAETFL